MIKYKVLIKKCDDPQRANLIAGEVANWSGSAHDAVYNAITQKAICIRKEAEEDEALRFRAQFGAIGAEVELVPLQEKPTVAAAFTAAPAGVTAAGLPADGVSAPPTSTAAEHGGDYEDDDEPGRILNDAEYIQMCKERADIFHIEKESRLRNIELVCMVLAIAAGIFLSTRTFAQAVATDFLERLPTEVRTATLLKKEIEKKVEEKKQDEVKTDKKQLKPTKSQGVSSEVGGGDPRARITQKGVLGIVSGQIKGTTVASADIFGKGGFATDIDAILTGMGGLKSGGDGGVGRKGMAGIGHGFGPNSGFGGPGGGGIEGLLNTSGAGGSLDLKKRGHELKFDNQAFLRGGALTGGRSKASIQRVVMQNIAALKYAYNRRLRDKPGLNGKITVKFAIDEFGKVISAMVIESTMADSELEKNVVDRVKSWDFGKIDKPGDVTEVTYPFVFAQ